jgi:hypothetical protein
VRNPPEREVFGTADWPYPFLNGQRDESAGNLTVLISIVLSHGMHLLNELLRLSVGQKVVDPGIQHCFFISIMPGEGLVQFMTES